MKLFSLLSISIFTVLFIFSSCSKNDEVVEMPCLFEISIEPVCSFNPKNLQTVSFPVRIINGEVALTNPEFEFSWNIDQEFKGSAISVTYEQLPLEVEVTEVATGCTTEAILENNYWD